MRRDHKQFKSQKTYRRQTIPNNKDQNRIFFFRSGVQKQEHVFVVFSPPFPIVPAVVWTRSGGINLLFPWICFKPAPRQGNKSRKTSVARPQGPIDAVVCCDCKSQKLKAMKEGDKTVQPGSVIVRVIRKSESGPRGSRDHRLVCLPSMTRFSPLISPLIASEWLANLVEREVECTFFLRCVLEKQKASLPNGFQSDESCRGETVSGEEPVTASNRMTSWDFRQ